MQGDPSLRQPPSKKNMSAKGKCIIQIEDDPPEIHLLKEIFYYWICTLNTQSTSDSICCYQTASLSPSSQPVSSSSSHPLLSVSYIALDLQHFLKPLTVTSGEMCRHAFMIPTKYYIYISWFIKLLESMKIHSFLYG